MADKYVYDAATGTGSGDDWTNAYTTLQAGMTNVGAGDTVWVHNSHAETAAASTTLTSSGTAAAPINVVSASGTGTAFQKGAKFSTNPSTTYDLNIQDFANFIGMEFEGRRIYLNESGGRYSFTDCVVRAKYNSSSNILGTHSAGAFAEFFKCTFELGNVNAWMAPNTGGSWMRLIDCEFDVTTIVPNKPLGYSGSAMSRWDVRGGDFSNIATGAPLFRKTSSSNRTTMYHAAGALLPTSGTIAETFTYPNQYLEAYSVGTGTNLQEFEIQTLQGIAIDETGIYRTTAKSQYDQSGSHYSIKVTPRASCSYGNPFRMLIWQQWATANPTLTVELFYDSATSLNDTNCWIEVDHPDATNTVRSMVQTTRNADIGASGTNLTTSSLGAGDWTGESGSNQNFQKIAYTVSSGGAGMHRVFFCMGTKATTPTVYVCPDVEVT